MAVSKPSISTSHKLMQNIKLWGRNAPAYLVIHFTSGFTENSDTTGGMASIYASYLEKGSNAHYLVGKSAIWEMVNPKMYYCLASCGAKVGEKKPCQVDGWGVSTYQGALSMSHAGIAGHTNTINVEICSCKVGKKRCDPMDDGWYFNDETYLNAVRLCAWICDEFGIKVSNIIMHNQVTGKLCPAMWCNRGGAESGFDTFKQDVSAILNELEEDTPVSPSPAPKGGTITVAADCLFYSRPSTSAPIIAQGSSSAKQMKYTVQNGSFYYTDSGWVQA